MVLATLATEQRRPLRIILLQINSDVERVADELAAI